MSSKFCQLLVALVIISQHSILCAQNIIDTKQVGGPKTDAGDFEHNLQRLVVASNGSMWVLCADGIFGSVNKGVSWTHVSSGTRGDFCFTPEGKMYAAGSAGVFSSTSFGASWKDLSAELPNGPFYSIVVTPTGTVLTGCPSGLFRSTNEGLTWDHVANKEIPFSSALYLTVTPKGTVLARNGNAYFRSTDEGLTWSTSVPLTITIWPISENNILRQGSEGIQRSTDDGVSWHNVPNFPGGLIGDLAINSSGDLFCFIGWKLYVSKDSGTTWSEFGTISGGGNPIAFTPDNTLYYGTPTQGIWRTLKPLSGVEDRSLAITSLTAGDKNVSFFVSHRSHVTLSLYDVSGVERYKLLEGECDPSLYRVALPILSSGLYFCVLRTETDRQLIKIFNR
jgi:hypothetical protein